LYCDISLYFYLLFCYWWLWEVLRSNTGKPNKLKSTKSCSGCDLTAVDLVGFVLRNANLNGFANLSKANLSGADLTGAKLTDANLIGVNLTGANLTNAKLDGVILTDAQDSMLLN
jgi:uncharacterized protein YjbI with pentapeptide repeats